MIKGLLTTFRNAGDTFLREAPVRTVRAPHIRDAVDLKRWMVMVVFALTPCILMAIWNSGLQKFVYTSGDASLMQEYFASCHSLSSYFGFVGHEGRWLTIVGYGLAAFIPVMVISYMVGGLVEGLFAYARGHEIAEGFLVTGILYALILPSTIPYWMVAFGVAVGIIFAKELFGGTGMNIVNPALACRAFLFFTFPGQMSGDVWAGTNPVTTRNSLIAMNKAAGLGPLDGFTQATALAKYNITTEIKRVHVDAIANKAFGVAHVPTQAVIDVQAGRWGPIEGIEGVQQFVTAPMEAGGLGLSTDNFDAAYRFATLQYEQGILTDWNLFLGNKLGSFGEVSVVACLLGAALLIYTRIGAWRTMLGMVAGAYLTALLFQLLASGVGVDGGAWNPAIFAFPAYKHLLLGGLAFGAVYMATDPVSSASLKIGKWIYGALIGFVAVLIRAINPAYPEGVMLAILVGNVVAPLIDTYVGQWYCRRRREAHA